MNLGINATNIRQGGGVTHLVELLRAADPPAHGFGKVRVWSVRSTLDRIEPRPWLETVHEPGFERGLAARLSWQRFRLAARAREAGCDLLFAPGASDVSGFRPLVTMSQNLLPFEWGELRRFGPSWMALKMALLRGAQARTLRRADGVIFLSRHAREVVLGVTGPLRGRDAVIPHGIDGRFFQAPRPQRAAADFTPENPCRILYVSIHYPYKHQWNVIEAVGRLRAAGLPVTLDVVGPEATATARVEAARARVDPEGRFIRVRGEIPYGALHEAYAAADVNVFASSCENLPITLLEGMAAGLPTACSRRGPMPEVLGEGGEYFDPEEPEEIARAIRALVESPELRAARAAAAFERARAHSWKRCADETFAFLARVCEERGQR